MNEIYTFNELLEWATEHGQNLAHLAIGRMMDEIEEETGEFPSWDYVAPSWVVDNIKGKIRG